MPVKYAWRLCASLPVPSRQAQKPKNHTEVLTHPPVVAAPRVNAATVKETTRGSESQPQGALSLSFFRPPVQGGPRASSQPSAAKSESRETGSKVDATREVENGASETQGEGKLNGVVVQSRPIEVDLSS